VINAMPRIAVAVNDFEAAVATFRDGLGMPVLDFSARTAPDLGACVGMCVPPGGSNVELMAPADPSKPLSQALQKFLDHRGEGLYALMLEAPDPDAEAEELIGRGLDVLPLMRGAGGRDVHPRSTHGVLIRVYPDNSVTDPGGHEVVPPALSGIATVIVATDDAEAAAKAYGHGLGLAVETPSVDEERGVRTVVCRPPKGGVIELVSAVDATRPFAAAIRGHLADRGAGMFALVLEAGRGNPAAVLADRGLEVEDGGDLGVDAVLTLFGARFLIRH
jgi:catechol 2,3-dioxygenase-like lactoylglutathione lyase family enzyme